MTTSALAVKPEPAELAPVVQEAVLLGGDMEKLKPQERVSYMLAACKSLGLNPLTKPFEFIRLNGKLVMYARKDCTEQLRKLNAVSIRIVSRELTEDVYVVTAQATDGHGRVDESIGAVPVKGLQGEAKANALMKAETKAKRRVTLSISGLGMLDETEVDSVTAETGTGPNGRVSGADVTAHFAKMEAATAAPKEPAPTVESAAPATSGDAAPVASTSEPAEFQDLVETWRWSKEGAEWLPNGPMPKRTLAQNNHLHALRTEVGITDEQWRGRLAQLYNKESSADLSEGEASDLIDKLEARKRKYGTKAEKDARQQRRLGEAVSEIGDYLREPGSDG